MIVLIAAAISYVCYVRGDQNPYARFAADGLAIIGENSLAPISSQELFDAAMTGMVGVLERHGDEHSRFFDQRETEALLDDIHQQFGGIGVRIQFLGDPPALTVIARPDPGTPAERAGLVRGDRIVAIDDRPTAQMTMDDVLVAMRGDAGAAVRLQVLAADAPESRSIEIVRENITVESVLGDIRGPDGRWQFALAAEPRIAHVRIRSFGDLTSRELDRVLGRLVSENVQAVALDVRDNSGGTLDAAIDVCSLFLPPGRLVVETRSRDRRTYERHLTSGIGPYTEIPLAVIMNQNSASAAEIVAAALQDHDRAITVGQRTYGKGTVQQLVPVEAGRSTLKLTWAGFWRPSGANIHRTKDAPPTSEWGVRPDAGRDVALTEEEYEMYIAYRTARDIAGLEPLPEALETKSDGPVPPADFVDRQLAAAVEALQAQLNRGATATGADDASGD
jgi:carboxyl-terminal processing protease